MVASVVQEGGGEHRAVVHRDRQTDGRAALIAVQYGHDVVHIAVIDAADRVKGVAQAAFSRHHEIVLIKEQIEQQQDADEHERDEADG